MKKINLGTNFVIFLLFFGGAVIEGFNTKNWLKCAFWLMIGAIFLAADNMKTISRGKHDA